MVMEVHSTLIFSADHWQLLQPLGIRSLPHRAALYADIVLFIRPRQEDL
jgi:hypothetical protein